mmetsp:Transcript_12829/g.38174  ORF Transcript_12829/g.38174 Transcript_12829/m.38174 type:complete len:356 (+) Transcript_12829:865-1932(+)
MVVRLVLLDGLGVGVLVALSERLLLLRADPRVLQDLAGGRASGLLLVEHDLDEVLARRVHPSRYSHELVPDVLLVFEREARRDQAEHDDAQRPHVHLHAVAPVVHLRRPVHLRAALHAESGAGRGITGHTKVGEDHPALPVRDVGAVQQVVVALDVAVHDLLAVAVGYAPGHLVREVGAFHALHLPPGLEVALHARHHVPALVQVHDDTDEAPLVVDAVALHDVRVVQGLHQPSLLLDDLQRRLHLVDHLHGPRETVRSALALRDDAERTLAELPPHDVLIQQLLSLTQGLCGPVAVGHGGRLAAAHAAQSLLRGTPPPGGKGARAAKLPMEATRDSPGRERLMPWDLPSARGLA